MSALLVGCASVPVGGADPPQLSSTIDYAANTAERVNRFRSGISRISFLTCFGVEFGRFNTLDFIQELPALRPSCGSMQCLACSGLTLIDWCGEVGVSPQAIDNLYID